jgi:hypothetical protein
MSSLAAIYQNIHEASKEDVVRLSEFFRGARDNMPAVCAELGVAFDEDAARKNHGLNGSVEGIARALYEIVGVMMSRWPDDETMLNHASAAFDNIWDALHKFIDADDLIDLLCGSDHPLSYFSEELKALGFSEVINSLRERYEEELAEAEEEP